MADEPARPAEAITPPDPNRRRFFRQFAGDVMSSMGSVIGAAQLLQQESAQAARELLGEEPSAGDAAGAGPAAPGVSAEPREEPAAGAGFRAPMRWDGDVCHVVDQRRLPDMLVDLEVSGAADGVAAIRDGALVGAPAQAQLAAVTLALVAGKTRTHRPFARRATIRGAANALRVNRPGSAALLATVSRMLAVEERLGIEASGDEIADAMRAEAAAIIAEASDAHGALVGHALAALDGLPGGGDEGALRVLTFGSTGAMGGGQFGTALSAVIAAHHAERQVTVLVAETRPGFEGSRVAAWELREAGVTHAVITDAAAPGRIAAGEVDVVLVGADRVVANGDVIAPAGTYPLALAASAAGVPVIVCVATIAVDPATADGAAVQLEDGLPGPVLTAAGTRVAPVGTTARNPTQDVTPARLVAMIVTERGTLRAPFETAIAGVVDAPAAAPAPAAAGPDEAPSPARQAVG